VSNERGKFLFEKGFNEIVDEINDLILKLANKGIGWKLVKQQVIGYFNNHNINLQEIYNWLVLNNHNNSNSIFFAWIF
jgi:hypothetical protein